MELPRLQQLWEKYRRRGLSVVAVEYRRDTEAAKSFIQDNGLTYHFLENGEGEAEIVNSLYKVYGFPSTFVIDRNGRVMYFHYGFQAGDEIELERQILSLLGE